jgi:hypothetical protein
MNLRKCLTCCCCLCLALLLISSTNAQIKIRRSVDEDIPSDLVPKVKGFERTDLFNDHYLPGQTWLTVAKTAYQKLKFVNEQKPGIISAENLQGASLEWFKAQLSVSKSRSEYIQAATEYLEREGIPVGRLPDE